MSTSQFPDLSRLMKVSESFVDIIDENPNCNDTTLEVLPGVQCYSLKKCEEEVNEESDAEDENNEDVMQWLANGSLQPNYENILALNQAYQETVSNLMSFYEEMCGKIRSEQHLINKICDIAPNPTQIKITSKVPALLYIPPYFRDSADMCPSMKEAFQRLGGNYDFDMLAEKPRKWTERETKKLREAVRDYSFRALLRPHLSMKEILVEKKFFALKNETDESEIVKNLTEEILKVENEIRLLKKKRQKGQLSLDDCEGIDWNHVAINVFQSSRRPIECELAWLNDVHPKINHAIWKKEEILKLKNIVESKTESNGMGRNWDEIASKLGTNRTPFQCAEKYQMECNDNLVRKQWIPDEDKQLMDAIELHQIGDHIPWDRVVEHLDGRTRNQCQVRWNRTLDPKLKHGRWDEDEDKRLIRAVDKFGVKDWGKIAQIVVGRTDSQCRERWCTVLDDGIKDDRWNDREDAVLKIGVRAFGLGQWAKVRHLLPGRTAAMCKTRHKSLRKLKKLKKKTIVLKPEKDRPSSKNDVENVSFDPNRVKKEVGTKIVINKRLNDQIERKKRVRQWYYNKHGRFPETSVKFNEDVKKFLNSLSEPTKKFLETELASVLAG